MTKQKTAENTILEMTRTMIHLLLNKQTDRFIESISDDFVWIGDHTDLYTRGKTEFAAAASKGEAPAPLTVTEEEYSVLTHCSRLWVSFGRCAVSSDVPGEPPLCTKLHFNFVWRLEEDTPILIEVMSCSAKDPADTEESLSPSRELKETLRYRQTVRENTAANVGKLSVKEWRKAETHYLLPSEILYIKANNKQSIVRTVNKTIITGQTIGRFIAEDILKKDFIRIHKSYLVNSAYVDKICRRSVTLTDGTQLPVSRNTYRDIKLALSSIGEK
ncbi:MAG: LytTR family transcriptional regulator DNA-binding domain-containing protein [Oscillospiraceae bacterium]